ncbi:MAG: DUF4340 domain-containing protein [Verrucomicrobiota bacterium]
MRFALPQLVLPSLALGVALVALGGVDWRSVPPALDEGEAFYQFSPETVARVRLQRGTEECRFHWNGRRWVVTTPFEDELDPSLAPALVQFLDQARVVESMDRLPEGAQWAAYGLAEGQELLVECFDKHEQVLARLALGSRSPLQLEVATEEEERERLATSYLRLLDREGDARLYLATGAVREALDRPFALYRNPHPFPREMALAVQLVFGDAQGEISLERSSPEAPWQLASPIRDRADQEVVTALLEDCFDLRATQILARPESAPSQEGSLRLSTDLALGGTEERERTSLEFHFGEQNGGDLLSVSHGQRDLVMKLPASTAKRLVPKVNDLRSRRLVHLAPEEIRNVVFRSPGNADFFLENLGHRWSLGFLGEIQPANDPLIEFALQTVHSKIIQEFVTDSLGTLGEYGFDEPDLELSIFPLDGSSPRLLRFVRQEDGRVWVTRRDQPFVVEVPESVLDAFPTRPEAWRDTLVSSFSMLELRALGIQDAAGNTIELDYNFQRNQWQAFVNGQDAGPQLDPAAAQALAKVLGNYRAERWLLDSKRQALERLENPLLTLGLRMEKMDPKNFETREETLFLKIAAPTEQPQAAFYYGRRDEEPFVFLLTPQQVAEILAPLASLLSAPE